MATRKVSTPGATPKPEEVKATEENESEEPVEETEESATPENDKPVR